MYAARGSASNYIIFGFKITSPAYSALKVTPRSVFWPFWAVGGGENGQKSTFFTKNRRRDIEKIDF